MDPSGTDRSTVRAPAPFIVGVGRSGTTLLRLMLDAHPELAIPPETHFVPQIIAASSQPNLQGVEGAVTPSEVLELITSGRHWGDFGLEEEALRERLEAAAPLDAASAIRSFFELYAERHAKTRWGATRSTCGSRRSRAATSSDNSRIVRLHAAIRGVVWFGIVRGDF